MNRPPPVPPADVSAPAEWSAWQPLAGWTDCNPRCLRETLDGGQAFRWRPTGENEWRGAWGGHTARLRLEPDGRLLARAPLASTAATSAELSRYLDLDRDYATERDALPWRTDPHLARCLAAFPGLRLLRQPFGETLLGFLCSATKQIVQIRQMCDALANNLGEPLPGGGRALPTWPRLAEASDGELRACGLGFRARHVANTARFLAERPGWLEEAESRAYPEAKEMLRQLPGVGEKVADCVLLFGAGKWEAFPVDVWILRVMETRYGLSGWTSAQTAQFGRLHYGRLAGYAQQFLFAWERANRKQPYSGNHTGPA